jgi:hypothetical protein
MSFFCLPVKKPWLCRKKPPLSSPPVNGLAPQSTQQLPPRQQPFPTNSQLQSHSSQQDQQLRPVCTWSAHAPQSGPSPLPFPRVAHTLTATANELFLFGGHLHGRASCDLYALSTRDSSTTLLQTSGEVPTPRAAHGAALIGTSTLLICGGTNFGYPNVRSRDSLYLLNLGTSDLLMSSPTPADHSFALQYRESGPALSSMVLGPKVVTAIPQPWSVPSSSSSVVGLAG